MLLGCCLRIDEQKEQGLCRLPLEFAFKGPSSSICLPTAVLTRLYPGDIENSHCATLATAAIPDHAIHTHGSR